MPRLVGPTDAHALRVRTERAFEACYGRAPAVCASAPGRANLIGEHTDYNDGFVLPLALERCCTVAAAPRADRRVRAAGSGAGGFVAAPVELDLDDLPAHGRSSAAVPRWADYLCGVVVECRAEGLDPGGFDAWVESDVPVGAGLSSSAALEVAIAGVVEALCGRVLDLPVKAALCRRAEHRYAGVPCGMMDQMAACLAAAGQPLLIDCRSGAWRPLALPAGEVRVVVVDSGLAHDLAEGAFARRVAECRRAAELLGLRSLRDADRAAADELRELAEPVLARRVLHVVEENARTVEAAAAIEARNWKRLGELMNESHASLRDLYEVSTPEMDALVEDLRRGGVFGIAAGATCGARMTGGGFGGCAVAMVVA